jgi:hypothetical protein
VVLLKGPSYEKETTAYRVARGVWVVSNRIQDDLTSLAISRQHKYQLRMERQGRCRVCGKPVAQGSRSLCLRHRIRARDRARGKRSQDQHQVLPGDSSQFRRKGGGAVVNGARITLARLAYRTNGVEVTASVSDRVERWRLGLPTLVQTFLTSLTWMCSVNGAPTEGWLAVTLANKESLWRVARNDGDSSSLRLIPVSGKLPAALRRVTGCFSV